MTDVSASSTFSAYGPCGVNASPVSISLYWSNAAPTSVIGCSSGSWLRAGYLASRGPRRCDNSHMDWGLGRYESTAAQLAPAAQVVVDHAAVQAGERVVDVGCGTGNAALVAAA